MHSDTVGISYCPVDNDRVQSPDRVDADFSDLVGRYGDRPLVFFPSAILPAISRSIFIRSSTRKRAAPHLPGRNGIGAIST